jgi:hypothetical protein
VQFPDDLPLMLEYRVGSTVRPTLCRRPVRYIGTSGKTDAPMICPRIPRGADAWRRCGETVWYGFEQIPEHWLPFLQRMRESEMDPRPEGNAPPNTSFLGEDNDD